MDLSNARERLRAAASALDNEDTDLAMELIEDALHELSPTAVAPGEWMLAATADGCARAADRRCSLCGDTGRIANDIVCPRGC